jgi:hypothetical protein
MQLFNRHVSTRSLTVFGGELVLIFGSVALAATLQGTPDVAGNFWKIGLVTVVCQLCLYYNDFYDLTLVHSRRELVVRLLQAVGAASIMLAGLYAISPALMVGDGIFRLRTVRLRGRHPGVAAPLQSADRLASDAGAHSGRRHG